MSSLERTLMRQLLATGKPLWATLEEYAESVYGLGGLGRVVTATARGRRAHPPGALIRTTLTVNHWCFEDTLDQLLESTDGFYIITNIPEEQEND